MTLSLLLIAYAAAWLYLRWKVGLAEYETQTSKEDEPMRTNDDVNVTAMPIHGEVYCMCYTDNELRRTLNRALGWALDMDLSFMFADLDALENRIRCKADDAQCEGGNGR